MNAKNQKQLMTTSSKGLFGALVGTLAIGALAATLVRGAFGSEEARIKTVFSSQLPNVAGQSLTALVVKYQPGGKSPSHRHAGSVFAYVLSGAIRSQNSATGPVHVYRAGESFFGPSGSTHLISENASGTQPASLLSIHIAETCAPISKAAK